MDTNDDSPKNECGENLQETPPTDDAEKTETAGSSADASDIISSEKEGIHLSTTRILQAQYDGLLGKFSAYLEVEYSWSPAGSLFTCNALRYRTSISMGGNKGNVHFGFSSWPTRELTNDNASQDGNWHDISGGGTAATNPDLSSRLYFKYVFDTPVNDPWASVELTVRPPKPPQPLITEPLENTSHLGDVQVKGTCIEGAMVFMQNRDGSELGGTTVVNKTNWTFRFNWQPGVKHIKAVQKRAGQTSDASALRQFYIKPSNPEITEPAEKTTHPANVRVTGTCMAGATVAIQNSDGSPLPNVTVSVNGTTWHFNYPWTPGTKHIKAVQTVNGQTSDASALREFYIKPPNPEITVPAEKTTHPANVRVTGTCMAGATVAIQNSDGSPLPNVTVSVNGTTWHFDYPWTPGTKHIKAVQTVNGQTSDASALREFYIKPPNPEITVPAEKTTHPANVRVTGTCMAGATVAIQNSDGSPLPNVTVSVNGTTWHFDYPWTPGTKHIKAVQTVNGQTSDASALREFYIKPSNPEITEPAEKTTHPANVRVTGTCMAGATVAIQNSDGSPLPNVTVSVNGTTWHFDYPWSPGTKHIKAVQTVSGQTSAASALREFYIKPSNPEITAPAEKTTHPANVRVSGTCMAGATVAIQKSDGSPLPNVTVSVNGTTWHFDYPWSPGTKHIKAVQTVSGQTSAASALREFYIKPSNPEITAPAEKTTHPANVRVTGTCMSGATVAIQNSDGSPLPNVTVTVYGTTWHFDYPWTPGTKHIKAVQTVDGQTSAASALREFYIQLAKPPKPAITPPPNPAAARQLLTITNVVAGTVRLLMSRENDTTIPGIFSPSTGTPRTFTPTAAWPAGSSKVKVVQTVDDLTSDPSDPATIVVRPAAPAITPPPNPAAARQPLTITNVSAGPVTLVMFNHAGTPIAGTFTGSDTTRTFEPIADWLQGSNTVYVVQTVDGVDSDPSEDCTFFVGAEKPEAPQFELPLEGSKTSSRPLIRVKGLSHAQITVRIKDAETLHSDAADADGVLEFKAATPLTPGTVALEVKQKGDGPESDWSELHQFTVKEAPKTPEIDAPESGTSTPSKPTIRGKGETRGHILLRHENDPENPIATINGSSSWRWTAKESWDLGTYTIQAQQTEDGDSSAWTEPRTFEVVDARYGIGDAGPVLSQPVVGTGQTVLLRVQVNSGDTGEPAEGVKVEWRIKGEQAVIATTETGPDGWARLLYTPDGPGTLEVLADITRDNQGVVMTESFEVTALLQDAWAQEAELYLNDELVDLAKGDLVLLTDKANELELRVTSNSVLIGSSVTLQDLRGATETGLKSAPDLGVPQTVEEGKTLRWSISFEQAKGGYFGLKLTSPALPDRHLPSQAETGGLANDVYVDFDSFTETFGGDPAHPCLGTTHVMTVRPTPYSHLLYKHVRLELSPEAAGLGVTISTESFRVLGENGVSWTLNCANSSQRGSFAVRLKVQEWDLSSRDLPMSLGHNKVEIAETSGPTQSEGGYWTYGIKAVSSFTKQPAGGVPVTVVIAGEKSTAQYTNENGWLIVHYNDGLSAKLSIFNPYDGSTVEPS